MVFKWDPRKAAANIKKHRIDFHEAATVLDDTLSTTFPDTEHSSQEPRFLTIGTFRGRAGTGLSVFDSDGQLRPAVREIVRLVARADVILGTGHLSPAEVRALIEEALQAGVRKILVNHPEIRFLDFPLDFQQEIAEPGVWFERCYMRSNFEGNWDAVAANMRGTGVRNNVLSTDLGQPGSVDPVTGFADMQMELSQRGFTETEMEYMCAKNPAELMNAA